MAGSSTSTHRRDLFEIAYLGLSLLGSFLILRWALLKMDPNKDARAAAKERSKQLAKRLGRPVKTDGQYEDVIAQEVVNPKMIHVDLSDIGGLDHIIDDLKRNIITPMRHPQHFRSSLLRQKRGVLLYGPPGTGKTMLAKALARECGACFINLKASTVLSKWYGDTNKLIAAVWTLARKIQPTILFIDEVDSLLGKRRSMEHEATTAMKTEFMQLWEGFETRPDNNIVVLGATNKKNALDDAVLRRFSLQYEVPLPAAPQREAILRLMMRRHQQEAGQDFVSPELLETSRVNQLKDIADRTEGYSGSDLDELCSQAAAMPVHQLILQLDAWEIEGKRSERPVMQPLSKVHFEQVLARMPPPSRLAQQARERRERGETRRAADRQEGSLWSDQLVSDLIVNVTRTLGNHGVNIPQLLFGANASNTTGVPATINEDGEDQEGSFYSDDDSQQS